MEEEKNTAIDTEDVPETSSEPELTPSEKRKLESKLRAEKRKKKKETEKLRKEYLKRQNTVPQNKKPVVCPPDTAGKSTGRLIAGFICRAVVIAMAVFSVAFFVTDAFGLGDSAAGNFGAGMIFLWAVVFTALISAGALLRPRIPAAAVSAVAVASIAAIKLLPNPVYTAVNGFKATFNAALDHMSAVGYLAIGEKKLTLSVPAAEIPGLIKNTVFLFILLLSVLYTICLIRRIRIWQLAAAGTVSAAILWLVFTYNISRSNWGVVLIIASFSALLVMFAFDSIYIRQTGADRNDLETANAAFNPEAGPEIPDSLKAKDELRRLRAEKKTEKAARKKKKKAEKSRVKTVDEEISDYFSEKPAKEKKKREKKRTPSPAEKAEARTVKKQKREEKKKERRAVAAYYGFRQLTLDAKCAAGGFAGIGMFLLASVMLVIPALATHDSFKTVDVIDKKFDYIREYVTAILMGDDPALDLLSFENNKNNFAERSTEPHAIYYTGKEIMHVESNTRYNVYLRGWIGTTYNDATGSWQTAAPGSDTLNTYRSLFGTTGSSVTDPSELMMNSFYSLYDRTAIPSPEERDYSTKINSHTSDGYVVAQVNMKRVELSSQLLYMPSFYLRSCSILQKTAAGKLSYFMRDYGSGEAGKITYANYFDGIYTSYRASKDKDGYAAVAMIPTMKVSGFYRTMSDRIASINDARMALRLNRFESDGLGVLSFKTCYYGENTAYVWYTERRVVRTHIETVPGKNGQPDTEKTVSVLERADYTVLEDGSTEWGENDGNLYIVLCTDTPGDAVYAVKPDGSIRKSVENVPDDQKFDAMGNEIVYSAPDLPFIVRYHELMTDEEKRAFEFYCLVNDYYTPFVYSTYRQTSSSTIIKELTAKILAEATETAYEEYTETDPETGEVYTLSRPVKVPADFSLAALSNEYTKDFSGGNAANAKYVLSAVRSNSDVYRQRHKLVMEFINYLCDEDNFTYKLVPEISEDDSLIGVEKFLAGTHEGSCVQYATALVLMLREVGIPARFVDGYVAAGFNTAYGDDKVASYTATVRDSNAHAWVEVWYDNIGWVQYEATPVYYDAMYETQSGPITPGHSGGSTDTDEDPSEPEDILTDEELAELIKQLEAQQRREMIRKIITVVSVILLSVGVILLVFFVFLRRAKKAQAERDGLVARFASVGEKDSVIPTGEDVRRLHELTLLMLSECGLLPKTGEFRNEYAERLASSAAGAIAKGLKEEKLSEVQEARFAMHSPEVAEMLEGYAAEEFGYGAEPSSMPLMARFFRRFYAAEYSRHVNPLTRLWHWFVKTDL